MHTNNKTACIRIAVIAVFTVEFFLIAWCRLQCIKTGYEIANKTIKYQKAIALQNSIKTELAHLKSPERIAVIAKHKLGLITPTSKQTIIIP